MTLSKESTGPTDLSGRAVASGEETRPLRSDDARAANEPASSGGLGLLRAGEALGRYLVLEQLGSGGMSFVFVAYDPKLDRRVALKVMRPDGGEDADKAQARLLREAQAMARLAHPNVVRIYDVGVLDERVYLAMELVDGLTLRDWLAARPRARREVIDVLVRAGRGLAAAHEAGLVHLDFKPRNVLVGVDGEVRVVDFGLARIGADADPSSSADGEGLLMLGEPVTHVGMVMGTPGYMASEQLEGGPTDARTDQFSFCVTAWEALYGERPYPGRRLAVYRESLATGLRRDPPASARVPMRLRRLLEHGLSIDPQDRHPSLTRLLDAMADEPARRWWQLGMGGLVLAGSLAMAWGLAQRPDPCDDVASRLQGAWDPERRAEVLARLEREDQGDGTLASQVAADLDAYATGWIEEARDACVAARDHQQSDELLDQRDYCLRHRRRALRATVELVLEPSPDDSSQWREAVHELPSVAGCHDVDGVQHVGRPPEDPALRESVERIDEQISRAWTLTYLGRTHAAVDVARPALRAAEASGHAPLIANAKAVLAAVLGLLDQPEEAERLGFDAFWAAEVAAMPVLQVEVLVDLVYIIGVTQGRFREAENLARGGLVLEQALVSEPPLRARLLSSLASVYATEGRAELAREHFEASLALVERDGLPFTLNQASTLSGLASALLLLGEREQALERYEQARVMLEREYGSQHPATLVVRENIAGALLSLDRHEQALSMLEACVEGSRTTGRDERTMASLYVTLGAVLLELRRLDEARGWLERAAVVLGEEGVRPVLLGVVFGNLATVDLEQGRLSDAVEHLEQGQRILGEVLPADNLYVVWLQVQRARLELEQGQPKEALERAARALPVLAAVADPNRFDLRAEAALVLSRVLTADPSLGAAAADASAEERSAREWAELAVHEAERGGRSAQAVLERSQRWLATTPTPAEAQVEPPRG